MSLNSEITRLQNAKATLKTKLNARNDNQHQIDDETIDEYGAFVDSIPQGGGGIDWSEIGYSSEPNVIQIGIDYAKQIMQNWNSSQTTLSSKFDNDKNLIFMPLVDTSRVTDFSSTFGNCSSLLSIPQLNTSSATSFYNTFSSCTGLKTIPQLNTLNVTTFNSTFAYCSSLLSIPQLDTSNSTTFASMFYFCKLLTIAPQLNAVNCTSIYNMFSNCISLTTFGGLLNLGQAYSTTSSANDNNYKLNLNACTNLTHDSLINVINGLYDIATKGCNTQQLILGSTNLAKLTAEEISTCTSKGWSVS